MVEAKVHRHYLPAAGQDWLLPLYDPLGTLLGTDRIRRLLIQQAALEPGQRILDIGSGTGAVLLLIKQLHPDVEAVGIDPDPKALARARRKAQRAALVVQFDQGFADKMPYPDHSFDRVFSSLMLHHIPRADKEPALREVRRVLKSSGTFHMVDLVGPSPRSDNPFTRAGHSKDRMADTSEDRIVALMKRAGFVAAEKVAEGRMLFWRIAYYRARSAS